MFCQYYKYLTSTLALNLIFLMSTFAQTSGSLTFNYTNPKPGSNAVMNVMAVWIENSNGTFIKTRCRYWSNKSSDHLPSWKSKSGQNIIDATTGATLKSSTNPTAFGAKTIIWNGTDVNGNVVSDGTYKVLVESAWSNPEPPANQHNFVSSFTFEKSTSNTTLTPSDPNLTNVSVTWTPSSSTTSDTEFSNSWNVSPNPAKNYLDIGFINDLKIKTVNITGLDGKILRSDKWSIGNSTIRIDVSGLKDGIYYVELILENNEVISKPFIINK